MCARVLVHAHIGVWPLTRESVHIWECVVALLLVRLYAHILARARMLICVRVRVRAFARVRELIRVFL